MSTMSRYALTFQNRVIHFDADIEFIDILMDAQRKNELLKEENKLFKYIVPEKHPKLASMKPTEQSRKIVVSHLRRTLYSSYIKDIFEELTTYLRGLLYEAAQLSKSSEKAKRIVGDQSKLSLSLVNILEYSTMDDLVMKIASDMIQALENEKSTKELIRKVCGKLDLKVEQSIIDNAMPYLDLRHKLIHADGKLDYNFKKDYPEIKCDKEDFVVLNYTLITEAKTNISKLVECIDVAAIEKDILMPNTL